MSGINGDKSRFGRRRREQLVRRKRSRELRIALTTQRQAPATQKTAKKA